MENAPNRRAVLGGGLLAVAAGPAAACSARSPRPSFDPGDWESVRSQFPLDRSLAHFAAFALAPHLEPVRRAVERHRAGLDRDTAGYLEEDHEGPVFEAAEEYLGASPGEVALTDSTTMGLGLLYGGLRLRPGQEVLTTEHDFYATHESLRLTGHPVRRVALYGDPARASADEIVSRLRAAVRPATRVVAITWVHSGTGVKLPVRAIADMLAEANRGRDEADRALLCVDGVHGLGAEAAAVASLGCDFFSSGTHKWLFGPRGTGVLWGREAAWSAVRPVIPSFSGAGFAGWLGGTEPKGAPGRLATPGGYHSFEHRWALREAFEFHRAIGRERVAARVGEQATRLKEGLAGVRGVRLVTPRDPALSAGLVCCEVPGRDPGAVVSLLRREHRIVAGVTPYARRLVRFGPGLPTTPRQVDQVVKAMAALV
ncbi:aminotransferase class V-fold PLP-dependent enzyme [Bailinhaonella thermotolerans]|uniref:Aminotransferase class V-fold PLP-dependent enzyme n=1 Tax=Bailinhaonella thermotolerans TaxID=1070861 RepID=A0A3A4BWY0_9ACTN|nr:aminotransferase class V-fold PLP-dependent enzyme [Bailinhaonella thermotolerans]RJL36088.1 aminotransferase class V-fold PLP-dependent enzyme [Bailinhaonella thermotolerans]